MDILITFEDGSTELRPALSPCVLAFGKPPRHPSEESLYLYSPGEYNPLSFCGHIVAQLRAARASTIAYCWRITDYMWEGAPIVGGWQSCRVETEEEQLARLTRERDAAEKKLAELRAWAEERRQMAERLDLPTALEHAQAALNILNAKEAL